MRREIHRKISSMLPGRPRHMHRRFAWLLGLALLLPLAQTMALCHGLSHVAVERAALASGTHVPAETGCDLCVTASGLVGGMAANAFALMLSCAGDHEVPQPGLILHSVAHASHYFSRAPPAASA